MSTYFRTLASERLKLAKSNIWMLVPISPLLALVIGFLTSLDTTEQSSWFVILFSAMATMHSILLLPILTGVFSAFVCRYEHAGGGWKQLLTLPISRTSLYMVKLSIVALLLAATQLLFLAAVLIAFQYHGIDGGVPWDILLPAVVCGWLACLPLAAMQLWASISWSSFAAPLAINVMLTIPNILIINSAQFGPFYPWAQPALAMLTTSSMDFGAFTLPLESLLITVLGSFLVFFAGGLVYFNRREI